MPSTVDAPAQVAPAVVTAGAPRRSPYPRQTLQEAHSRGATSYDCLIIGGGPAGLSAAIYLARFNRSVLVVDGGKGRSTSHELNENYLGFPNGIHARELRERGCRQARRFGAAFADGYITSVRATSGGFSARAGRKTYRAETIILATGVTDRFPHIKHVEKFVGVSLFWCITCDGWRTRNKRIVVVGNSDEVAITALQFLNFTRAVTVLTNEDRVGMSSRKQRDLARAGIEIVTGELSRAIGRGGKMRAVETSAGIRIPLDMMFSSMGCEPNIDLARALRLKLRAGYIETDQEQRTSRKRVYAAGDVTKAFAHQLVTAAHEGATAAQAANFDLYGRDQRG